VREVVDEAHHVRVEGRRLGVRDEGSALQARLRSLLVLVLVCCRGAVVALAVGVSGQVNDRVLVAAAAAFPGLAWRGGAR
jgi:hypothetical protein